MTFTALVTVTIVTALVLVFLTTLALVAQQERRELTPPSESVRAPAPRVPELA